MQKRRKPYFTDSRNFKLDSSYCRKIFFEVRQGQKNQGGKHAVYRVSTTLL